MKTDVKSASAEGLPNITRRRALASLAAIPAVAVAGSTAAIAIPTASHPWERARELADELADVLNEGDTAFGGPGGHWYAEIHPSAGKEYPVMFGNIKAREWPRRNVTVQLTKLIDEHKQASEAFGVECAKTDHGEPSKAAWRRWEKAHMAEEIALVAVCGFVAYGRADAVEKARYLAPYCRRGELYKPHILALINSAVRS